MRPGNVVSRAGMNEESDAELLARYRAGDVQALEALVLKYRRPLFAFILGMLNQPAEADEVFQEVWLKALRHIGRYRDRNLFGWLARIARNAVIDRVRRRRPLASLDAESAAGLTLGRTLPAGGLGPAEEAAGGDLGRRIEEAVARLPPEQREVFLLRMQGGMPFKEIARLQRVSINTALARMQYALAKLRTELREEYALLARGGGG